MTTHADELRDDGEMKPEEQGKALDDMVRSPLVDPCPELIGVSSSKTERTTPLPHHATPSPKPPTPKRKPPQRTDPPSQRKMTPHPQTATWAAAGTRDTMRMIRIDLSMRRRRKAFR